MPPSGLISLAFLLCEYHPIFPPRYTNVTNSMVACAHYPVDYQATTLNTRVKTIGPIVTFAGPPPDEYQPNATGFAGQFNGINQMVCAYIPSQLFP